MPMTHGFALGDLEMLTGVVPDGLAHSPLLAGAEADTAVVALDSLLDISDTQMAGSALTLTTLVAKATEVFVDASVTAHFVENHPTFGLPQKREPRR